MQESVTVSVGGGDAGPARAKIVGVDQLAVSQLQCQKVPVTLCVEEYSVRRHCLKFEQDGETGGERRVVGEGREGEEKGVGRGGERRGVGEGRGGKGRKRK